MFVVRIAGRNHIWHNKVGDDFLQFLPDHFGVHPDEIEAHFIPRGNEGRIKACVDLHGVDPDSAFAKDSKKEDLQDLDLSIVGKKVLAWPYDEEGKFLGHTFAE